MEKKDTTTYIFLASRLYPFNESNYSYSVDENGEAQLSQNKNQQIFALDIITDFSTSWQGDLTKYPVSGGSEISDHLSIRNNTYTLQGMVTDTPIEVHHNEYNGELGTGDARVVAAIEMLKTMFNNKVVFTLFSEHQQIDKAVITSVKFSQEAQEAINFSIDIEQVRFAYAKSVSLNVSKSTKKKVASNTSAGSSAKQQAADQSAYRAANAENKRINLKNQ